ncbi:MAG: alpha/beta hydrolase [Pseudomonadota bacterium]
MSEGAFAAADGRRLVYDDDGPAQPAGPPVLCLAGLTRDARDFAPLAALLTDRYRVIRLDSRGRGRSAHADNPMAEYQVAVEARDAVALLDHLGIARAAVIGTSRGGLLAMVLAATARDRLAGVALNDIGPVVERAGLEGIMGYIGRPPHSATLAEAAAGMAAMLVDTYPDFTEPEWLALAGRLLHLDPAGRPILSYDARLAEPVRAAFAAPQPDLWPLFDALADVPLAAVRGGRSNILSGATLAEMVRRRPDMVHVTLDNRGHVPILDEPPALAVIEHWLRGMTP